MHTLEIVVFEPDKKPYRKTIDNTLEALQQVVGGYIEPVTVAEGVYLICNEEGMLLDLPWNRGFYGTVFLIGSSYEEESYISLTEEQIKYFLKQEGELVANAN